MKGSDKLECFSVTIISSPGSYFQVRLAHFSFFYGKLIALPTNNWLDWKTLLWKTLLIMKGSNMLYSSEHFHPSLMFASEASTFQVHLSTVGSWPILPRPNALAYFGRTSVTEESKF
jgi:hypothetical protein